METFLSQTAIVLGVLALMLIGPAIGLAFLYWRRRRRRSMRRSPLTSELLRSPGHSLREQIEDEETDFAMDVDLLMLMPVMLALVILAQQVFAHATNLLQSVVIYGLVVGAALGLLIRRLLAHGRRLDALRAGYDAEQAVGQELDQLMRKGAGVFHDLAADDFNIDHIVVSSTGLFAIETKGYTKPIREGGAKDARVVYDGKSLAFPHFSSSSAITQAERQAKWLQSMLVKATADPGIVVTPVVALPGWFVERAGRGPVRVYNGRELQGLLAARGVPRLSAEQVQRIEYQLEQRCRDVKPRYDRSRSAQKNS